MVKKPPSAVAIAVLKSKPLQDPDATTKLRRAVIRARDIQQEVADLEVQLAAKKEALKTMFRDELPDLMDSIGSRSIELAGEGNQPPFIAKLVPYYYANIAADWPDEKKKAAFDWLTVNGHGDLIKTNVAIPFKREDRLKALALVEKLVAEMKLSPTVKEEVHFMTLTAWLREQVEEYETIPPLDLFGGDVGRVVQIKPVKEK